MLNPRKPRLHRNKQNQLSLPLDTQCWVLAVASTLCQGAHRPSLSGLTAVRRALIREDRHEVADILNGLIETRRATLSTELEQMLRRLAAEVRYGSSRRIQRLAAEIVHTSVSNERDAC